jgi:hypothetical protein
VIFKVVVGRECRPVEEEILACPKHPNHMAAAHFFWTALFPNNLETYKTPFHYGITS